MRSTDEMRGVRVCCGKKGTRGKKIGKVSTLVFYPTGKRVAGFIVRRPDLLWMFKRKSKFLALDAIVVRDGRIFVDKENKEAWDEKACFRLDIEYDKCIIWEEMPVRTVSGENRGRINSISYDERNGNVIDICISEGYTAKAILGNFRIPAALVRGYNDGYIWIEDEAAKIESEGGAAAKAGEGVAKAGAAASKAASATGKAINKGAYKTGELIGKAKRALEPDDEPAVKTTPQSVQTVPQVQAQPQQVAVAQPAATQQQVAATAQPAAQAAQTQQYAQPAAQVQQQTAPAQKKQSGGVAHAVGKSLSRTNGMFKSFKEEYNKAKNGE